jgi:hypothetical protein
MNPELPPILPSAPPAASGEIPPVLEAASNPAATPQRRPKKFRAALMLTWRFALGVFLSQSLLFSFVVVGWVQRMMRRTVLRQWWRRSELARQGTSFESFARGIPELAPCALRTNLFFDQDFRDARKTRGWKALSGSLIQNAKFGVQAVFNTWVLTLPGLVLMNFGWYDGWNNSFTKGYEHAFAGPSISWLGIMMFIAAMLYVPMAQAHQASSGSWRAFYQWRLVWRVARQRWAALLALALVYAAVSLPVTALRVRPYFAPQIQENETRGQTERLNTSTSNERPTRRGAGWQSIPTAAKPVESLSAREVERDLAGYFLRAGFVVLGGLLLVRWMAARIYAGGLLSAVRKNDVPAYALSAEQLVALEKLHLLAPTTPSARPRVLAVAGRLASLAGRFAAGFAFFFIWFAFVAQVYVMQFLNYLPIVGWANQPLVQLPWIKYVPHEVTGELWSLVVVAGLALAFLGARSAWCELRQAK